MKIVPSQLRLTAVVRLSLGLGIGLLVTSCGAAATTDSAAIAANGVSIQLVDRGSTRAGDSVTAVITNGGSSPVYMPQCDEGPSFSLSEWNGTSWGPVAGVACTISIVPTGPIELDAGASLTVVRFISFPGRYEASVGVARLQSLADVAVATSNAIDVAAR